MSEDRAPLPVLSEGTPSLNDTATPAGHAVVRVDNDGDGPADLEIVLPNTPALSAAGVLP